jgi:cytosine/adenosine deaminase-related metal-dependent hydrolase
MVELLGMKPIDVIRSATSLNAKVFGWQNEVGTLEAGLQADLLVVDGDPLQDIRVWSDPSRIDVYQAGRRIERVPLSTRRRLGHERGFGVSTGMLHHPKASASPSSARA